MIKNNTVFAEVIRLEERSGKHNYLITVPNQNDEKPASFELNKNSNKQLVFEYPSHNYPTKITYNQVGTDRLLVEISGMNDGMYKNELFK